MELRQKSGEARLSTKSSADPRRRSSVQYARVLATVAANNGRRKEEREWACRGSKATTECARGDRGLGRLVGGGYACSTAAERQIDDGWWYRGGRSGGRNRRTEELKDLKNFCSKLF
ncbi:hypothetical protein BVRB_5g108130 [Beta vulgaris subsp. vulgaris]|nr:hypothetical protein BVRB_5g108130 [Beta vulgaris subsp. vulgaris]